jgi:hypothetical protein
MAFVFLATNKFEFDPVTKPSKYKAKIPGPADYNPNPNKSVDRIQYKNVPFNSRAKKIPVVKSNERVGPGLYSVDTSLEAPLVIKNNLSKGSYFIYERGKISKKYQTYSV